MISEIIAEKGEGYVYTPPTDSDGMCMYYHADQPGCIVGHLINKIDPSNSPAEGHGASYVLGRIDGVTFDSEAARYLEDLQSRQDGGTPWGEANTNALWAMRDE